MAQTDRNGATTTPPSPPPQLQEVLDAPLAAQAAAEAAALAAATTPVAAPTHGAASKTTPVDADELPLIDSAASFGLKRLTWANLKATFLAQWQPISDAFGVVKGSADATKILRFEVDGFTSGQTRIVTPPNRNINLGLLTHGQCRLSLSGANLLLAPVDGNKLIINSQFEDVPDAGITLAPPATSGTLYYIYAYMVGSTMTLEASTTAYAVQAATGVTIKTGDATRTLVGMARTESSAWVNSASQRLVRTYFNDLGGATNTFFTANRNTSSSSFVELNTEIRSFFLVWARELVEIAINGSATSGAAGDVRTTIGIDGTTPEDVYQNASNYAVGASCGISLCLYKTGLSEGYHYATLLGAVLVANANWFGAATAPLRCTLQVRLKR